jgi:hypothetical protein
MEKLSKWALSPDASELSLGVTDISGELLRRSISQLYKKIDAAIWEAIPLGKDVAVSEAYRTDDHTSFVFKTDIILIEPGAELPRGKRWTVHHCSRLQHGHA